MIFTEKDEYVDAEIDKNNADNDKNNADNDNLNKSINMQKQEVVVQMASPEKNQSEDAEMYKDNAMNYDNLNKSIKIKRQEEAEEVEMILPKKKNVSEDAEIYKDNVIKDENLNVTVNLQIFSYISYLNIPISDNIHADIVTKGSHYFQNKEEPFGSSIRPGINSKSKTDFQKNGFTKRWEMVKKFWDHGWFFTPQSQINCIAFAVLCLLHLACKQHLHL